MPFQKGNKNALGNDKSNRLSTWIAVELEREYDTSTLAGYEEKMTAMKLLARKIVEKTTEAESLRELIEGLQFIANRTEGTPTQRTELTGKDGEELKVITFSINQDE